MAIQPFISSPFGYERSLNSPRRATELAFTKNFDINKPAVMVFFAHGHKATLEQDVIRRQKVLQQLEKAGLNAVLVAPQLAFNAKNSSAGRFSEPGFANKFFDEAAEKLAQMHDEKKYNQGRPSKQTVDTFRRMPVWMVSYSGGYGASLAVMEQAMRGDARLLRQSSTGGQPTLAQRIKGAVLLDTLYGGGDTIKRFANQPHHPFVVSNFIENPKNNLPKSTNRELQAAFRGRHNVKIYQEYGRHTELVEKGLAKALSYVPGYRGEHPAPKMKEKPKPGPNGWHIG